MLLIRSMKMSNILNNGPLYPVITKKNILKYIGKDGATEQRLFQIFLGHLGETMKKYDKYSFRLVSLLGGLKKNGRIDSQTKNVKVTNQLGEETWKSVTTYFIIGG